MIMVIMLGEIKRIREMVGMRGMQDKMRLIEVKQINEMKEINKPQEMNRQFAIKQIKGQINKMPQLNPIKKISKEE